MPDPFDGMAAIFASTIGEPVIYTPIATGVPIGLNGQIMAIWIERSLDVVMDSGMPSADAMKTELGVQVCDVPDPQEGDTAQRVKNGKVMTVSTPILPDGQGIIVCNLATPG